MITPDGLAKTPLREAEKTPRLGCDRFSPPNEIKDSPKSLVPVSEQIKNSETTVGETIKIDTINQKLEGQQHPETDIPYTRVDVTLPDGTKVEGVFPEFDPVAEVQLDTTEDGAYKGTRAEHERQCNEKLKELIDNNPKLREQFTSEQLEQIADGETPDGYTWHHHQEPGKLQLVDSEIHGYTRHTGGYAIWGKTNEESSNA